MRRTRRDRLVFLVDLLVVLWVAGWIAVGVRIADEVEGLRDLGGSVAQTGRGIERTGEALGGINVPFVGGQLDDVAEGIVETGQSTQRSARQGQESAENLSTLLGVAIALIPSSAILIPYIPLRVARIRERRALEELERRYGDDPELDRLLAARATHHLSYHRLRRLGIAPWQAETGDQQRLADAERARLGLERVDR